MKFVVFGVACLAILGLVSSACEPVAPSSTARDGKTLATQPQDVQNQFRVVWGDQADTEWVKEHNAEPTATPPTPSPAPKLLTLSDHDAYVLLFPTAEDLRAGWPSGRVFGDPTTIWIFGGNQIDQIGPTPPSAGLCKDAPLHVRVRSVNQYVVANSMSQADRNFIFNARAAVKKEAIAPIGAEGWISACDLQGGLLGNDGKPAN